MAVSSLVLLVPALHGQSFQRPLAFLTGVPNGPQLTNVTASVGYYPNGSLGVYTVPGSNRALSDALFTGSAVVGWTAQSARQNFSITYSPTYTSRWRYPDWNTTNHAMTFNVNRQFSAKWSANVGVSGNYSNTDTLLFAPTAVGQLAALPASFDQLASQLLQGQVSTGSLASILTSTPLAESPARALLYGQSALSTTANISLSYMKSPRTTISTSFGGTRTQHIGTDRDEGSAGYLLNHSTGANAGFTVSHSLSPRTQIGVTATGSRTFSELQDAYQTAASMFIGRRLGMRWMAQVHGGGGMIHATRQVQALPTGPQYQGGGSLGFSDRGHTIVAAVDRSFGDTYGIGAGSTLAATGSWSWSPVGRTWQTQVTLAQQRMDNSVFGNLNSWQVSTSLAKALTPNLMTSVTYVYANFSRLGGYLGAARQGGVLVAISWSPQPRIRGAAMQEAGR